VPDEKLLRQVVDARERIREREASVADARRELRAALVAAHDGGWSYAAIGRVLGISRQRVAALLAELPS
jgi:DNA-directed RNA polymerase specialized sigma24 family protein